MLQVKKLALWELMLEVSGEFNNLGAGIYS
jgi:hypothetical protein